MADLVLKNVYKKFGDNTVVNNFNLQIEDGEFIIFVGPSGCGKSTTLRMIAGLEEITSGEIYIDGRLVNDMPPKDRDIAMVFQNYALYPHMNVYDNMAFGLKLRKFPKDKIAERVKETAEILGMQDLLKRRPKELSGGQRQRVALGRAIVRNPKVFLMDEPLSNLDAKLRVQMRTELSKLHQRLKTTTIYVTHDQVEAMTMGDRIVVMKDGIIQQVASPGELYNVPVNMFVASFIGSPSMNFLPGEIIARDKQLYFKGSSFNVKIPAALNNAAGAYVDKPVVLGIRPEDIIADPRIVSKSSGENIKANIDVVEPLGAETYLYLNVDRQSITAKIEAEMEFHYGQQTEIAFKEEKVHLFDSDTQQAIR